MEIDDMRTTNGYFEGHDRSRLYYQLLRPQEPPRAALVFVHGIGEHCGRYGYLSAGLVKAGFAVFGYDHRGHGRSDGARGHIHSWEDYRDDLRAALRQVASLLAGVPAFLYGHSMGSLVVLDYLMESPEEGGGAGISGA